MPAVSVRRPSSIWKRILALRTVRKALLVGLTVSLLLFAARVAYGWAQQQQNEQQLADSAATSNSKKSAPNSDQSPSTASSAQTSRTPAATPQPAPAKPNPMVWVNIESGVYHKPGSRFYGRTKKGQYMTEADARKAGYRPAEK